MAVNGEPQHIGGERVVFHQNGWGSWYASKPYGRLGKFGSAGALRRAIDREQSRAKASKGGGGSGQVRSGGGLLADLFGLGAASSASTVNPKGATKVKVPWWKDPPKTKAKQAETSFWLGIKRDPKNAEPPWWML